MSANEQLRSLVASQAHQDGMRAHALLAAVTVVASKSPGAVELVESTHPRGEQVSADKKVECLANRFLTYIETGSFLT
jgi:hypothetical protein